MSRASPSESPALWVAAALLLPYACGYVTLRAASQNEPKFFALPLDMKTQPGAFILTLYQPIYCMEGRLRGITVWRKVEPPLSGTSVAVSEIVESPTMRWNSQLLRTL